LGLGEILFSGTRIYIERATQDEGKPKVGRAWPRANLFNAYMFVCSEKKSKGGEGNQEIIVHELRIVENTLSAHLIKIGT
jgi:hypothetical protein